MKKVLLVLITLLGVVDLSLARPFVLEENPPLPYQGGEAMEKKDPRMAYFVWGKNVLNYTQDKSYITGVKEYPNLASKTVRFDFSVGFYWNNSLKIPIPMQISSFNIESIDAFGAVFYKGAWKGVRFVD